MLLRSLAPLFLLLACPAMVFAHAIGLDVKPIGERVRVEAYYDDDTPAQGAKVTVRDGEQRTVAEGRTDDQGVWTFAKPKPGKYTVVVDAGDGHAARKSHVVDGEESPTAEKITNGPAREDFTSPAQRVGWTLVGLAAIAGLTLLAWLVRRKSAL
jgi:hypothetical protein